MTQSEQRVGFWAALLSALGSVAWFVTFVLQDTIRSVPDWHNLSAYAARFDISRLSYIYPSLLLAITYLIVLAVLYRRVPEERKIWALIALAVGIVYSVMATVNYNIQAVAVRTSLAAGETGGIELFLPDNPNSVFTALANSYVYMAISMVFAAFAFPRSARWIRWILLLQVVTALGQIGNSMFDLPDRVFHLTSMIWVFGAPAFFLLFAGWVRAAALNEKAEQHG